MTTVLGDKLQQAFKDKRNDVSTYVWKGSRKFVNGEKVQSSVKMVDMSKEAIESAIKQCNSMLYNTDYNHPGRYTLVERLTDQRNRCNAELFIRAMENPAPYSERTGIARFTWFSMLENQLKQQAEAILENGDSEEGETITSLTDKLYKQWKISDLIEFNESDLDVFADTPLYLIKDACLSALGRCNRKAITMSFIISLGLWFTRPELKELNAKDENGKTIDKCEQVLRMLNLDPKIVELHINDRKGLSLQQFKELVAFHKEQYDKRYNEITTTVLEVLRDKIFPFLIQKAKYQATEWEKRINQLLQVADYKGYKLED